MDLLTLALLLFVAGVILGLAEVFIPSGGVLAVLSVAAFVCSVVCAFKVGPGWGIGITLATPIVMLVVVIKGLNIFPKTRIGRKMILQVPEEDDPPSAGIAAGSDGNPASSELVGQVGVARSVLRPSGSAQIGNRRCTVVTLGGYISEGTEVRVVEVRGNRIVVEPAG